MPQYDNTNRWTLFKNTRKESDSHPDYTGTLNVDGVEFWISGWIKEGQKGKFFSGSIKPKESLREAANTRPRGSSTITSGRGADIYPIDDDIPF